ncbi:MAG: FlgD immunoglobulin-like domain containing protein, partial [Bacteroidales bacterium]|nr:FlgD immunoglobulin-like domain containing protein [Bacteroidales bacterium]
DANIEFRLPVSSHVTIDIFDLQGRKVATLVNEIRNSGTYALHWNGTSSDGKVIPEGINVVRMIAGNQVISRKIVFTR